jgi:hypothetical protein
MRRGQAAGPLVLRADRLWPPGVGLAGDEPSGGRERPGARPGGRVAKVPGVRKVAAGGGIISEAEMWTDRSSRGCLACASARLRLRIGSEDDRRHDSGPGRGRGHGGPGGSAGGSGDPVGHHWDPAADRQVARRRLTRGIHRRVAAIAAVRFGAVQRMASPADPEPTLVDKTLECQRIGCRLRAAGRFGHGIEGRGEAPRTPAERAIAQPDGRRSAEKRQEHGESLLGTHCRGPRLRCAQIVERMPVSTTTRYDPSWVDDSRMGMVLLPPRPPWLRARTGRPWAEGPWWSSWRR